MHRHEPVYHDRKNDLWAVTRHADIMAVSKRSDLFRNGKGYRPDAVPVPHMVAMDRPEHMVRRNLVNRGFTPRRVSAYEGRVREICTRILDGIAERGACDFVHDIAAPLPLIVISDVEEMLRWVSPIQNMMRTAAEDAEVGSHRIRAGDHLLLMYPSGNRDEAVFDDPFRFDVTRDPNPHVAFGGRGARHCLGSSLARLELRVMFEELLRRFPDMELAAGEPPPLRPANFVVGIEELPVRFPPARCEG
jgi:cytochrome P450